MFTRHRGAFIALALVAGLAVPVAVASPASAADGDLDVNYGVGGVASVPSGTTGLHPAAATGVGADGSVAVSAEPTAPGSGIRIIKLTPAGVRDAGFGSNGEIAVQGNNGGVIAVDSVGRVLRAATSGLQWSVARFTATGMPDPAFGTDGVVTFLDSVAPVGLRTLAGDAVQVVLGGGSTTSGAVRLSVGGVPDPAYGVGGRVALGAPVSRVALLGDGSFITLVSSTAGRYNSAGVLAASYSLPGVNFSDADVDSLGRVIVVGSTTTTPPASIVARFTEAGPLDATFGIAGRRTLIGSAFSGRVAVDAFDRPYATVTLNPGQRIDRLTTGGALDASFGASGSVSLTGASSINLGDIAFDGAGRLTVVGFSPPLVDVRAVRFVPATRTIDVDGPSITITNPVNGATYEVGQARTATYACVDPNEVALCAGTVPNNTPYDSLSVGTKTFTVNARDGLGNTSTRTITYTVADRTAPFITPVSPIAGQLIPQNAVVPIIVQCVDPFFGASGLATCTPAPGTLLDTSVNGPKTITYRATDNAGNVRTATITVQIVDSVPPTITGTSPAGRYLLGDSVVTDYACEDEAGGSGIVYCNAGGLPSGGFVNTGTPGPNVLEVVAIDAAGNHSERNFAYDVDDLAGAQLARGQELTTGGDTTTTDPIETSIIAGTAGSYLITERPATVAAQWRAVTYGSTITAPDSENSRPHAITLRLDRSVLDPSLTMNVQVLANQRVVPACDQAGKIGPDPCITDRTSDNHGATWVSLLTTKGATFVPVLQASPVPITSFNRPLLPNVVTASDRTFTVTYGFSTPPGATALTGVFASDPGECTESGVGPARLSLAADFSGRSSTWRYEYKAPSTWRGTCRQIVVAWADGRTDRYLVQF